MTAVTAVATAAGVFRRRTRPLLLGEIAVVVLLVGVYDRVRDIASTRAGMAMTDATRVLDVERWLHIDIEHGLNNWLAGHLDLELAASWYYQVMHLTVTLVVLVLLYALRPNIYRSARTALIGVNVLGLLVFWLLPVAPPRLLPGFIDSQVVTGVAVHSAHVSPDVYAAMPSLHVGWATWVLLQVWAATTRRSLRTAAATHLALTIVIVIATANHFTLDVIAGAVVALLAAALSLPTRSRVPDRELALTA
jgi:hypothetical protein